MTAWRVRSGRERRERRENTPLLHLGTVDPFVDVIGRSTWYGVMILSIYSAALKIAPISFFGGSRSMRERGDGGGRGRKGRREK